MYVSDFLYMYHIIWFSIVVAGVIPITMIAWLEADSE